MKIIGGGSKHESLLKPFIDLSGGPEAPSLLVPSAAEGDGPTYYWEDRQDLERAGARHITVLHTRDRKMADSEAFVAPIRQAGGVFLTGRPAVAPGRCLPQHPYPCRASRPARPGRHHRRNVGRGHDSGLLHGARRHQG